MSFNCQCHPKWSATTPHTGFANSSTVLEPFLTTLFPNGILRARVVLMRGESRAFILRPLALGPFCGPAVPKRQPFSVNYTWRIGVCASECHIEWARGGRGLRRWGTDQPVQTPSPQELGLAASIKHELKILSKLKLKLGRMASNGTNGAR
eukprot:307238-Rhodomonas_salina.1